jgi:hypothetical protein
MDARYAAVFDKVGKAVMFGGWGIAALVGLYGAYGMVSDAVDKPVLVVGGAIAGAWLATLVGGALAGYGHELKKKTHKGKA